MRKAGEKRQREGDQLQWAEQGGRRPRRERRPERGRHLSEQQPSGKTQNQREKEIGRWVYKVRDGNTALERQGWRLAGRWC